VTAALVKLVHVLGGIYIWEFVTNLGFEYSFITGKRKFTWTFLLYLGCRLCPLVSISSQFLEFDLHHEINCQVWVIVTFMFGYLSFAFASSLIVLRVVALWGRNKIVVALVSVFWLADIGSYIYCAVTSEAIWNGEGNHTCAVLRTERGRIGVISTLISDLVILVLMLVGLLRWKNARQRFGIWWFLFTQGFVWLLLVTLAEVPPTVFLLLDLNGPLNIMFQVIALITMAIGASRIYRALIDFPALNLRSAKAAASSEWAIELHNVPVDPSHNVCVAAGTHTIGRPMTTSNGQSSSKFNSVDDNTYVPV